MLTLINKEAGFPFPHVFEGITEIFPDKVPKVKVIEAEELVPVHPDGAVHVYETPASFTTE